MRFSERYGFKQVRSVIQVDSIDDDLKNGLWNSFYECILHPLEQTYRYYNEDKKISEFYEKLWKDFLKDKIDSLHKERYLSLVNISINSYFFSSVKGWFQPYDLIEYFVANFPDENKVNDFVYSCNLILEREKSAYRFVNGALAPIIEEEEIKSIEDAVTLTPVDYAKGHLRQALELFADKKAPDYPNSIKESISAVESMVSAILGEKSATLGKALKQLEEKTGIGMHTALKGAFEKIYGYTSDSAGIRHGKTDDSTAEFEEAKFMLVTCSAFVNYLTDKANKAGITLVNVEEV
ncbi:AbiJ-NTD4 domain-containing protein [Bacillus cereus]|uniref:HEPN AbiJ-N-terminal domain-containing protein n=1 Tax=Bacillus cereus HuA4-10 TaxID=1053206 RepID=J8D4B2_BACCE|nr:hypothetical protein [Bacillus cereus]EJQ74332.1 hypothetical protein IGC_04883 [Bacillus cereus HuA4-10]